MNALVEGGRVRVLTLVDDVGTSGGGERFARDVTQRIDGEHFERIFCVSRWTPARERDPEVQAALGTLEASGVRFLGLPRRSTLGLAAWRPLLDLMRAEPVDVLHAHKFGSNVWGSLLARVRPVPVFVAHEQTWSYRGKPLRRFLDRELIARRADAFIAVSSEDRRRMIEVERIDAEKIVVLANAIPTPQPKPDLDVRAQVGIPAEAPLVGVVCVLRPQKALEVLLEATARLRDEFSQLRVVVAGEGPERERLERMIAELGLQEVVSLLGHRDDVSTLVGTFDVAVLSSDFEGTPLAVMEYMEAARPIVATRVGGVPDLIDDGVHGLLVPPRDPGALADAIGELLRDRARAGELGDRARQRRRAEFDLDAAARRLERLYERLLAAKGRP